MSSQQPQHHHEIEEHELPCIEAVLACTFALMTGYSQALQAAAHPAQRLQMGRKITRQLSLLAEHAQLSCGFRHVLAGLSQHWQLMSACTEAAEHDCAAVRAAGAAGFCFDAPVRLQ